MHGDADPAQRLPQVTLQLCHKVRVTVEPAVKLEHARRPQEERGEASVLAPIGAKQGEEVVERRRHRSKLVCRRLRLGSVAKLSTHPRRRGGKAVEGRSRLCHGLTQ
eukprot:1290137-Pleurochrysis_carterae.AAC.1